MASGTVEYRDGVKVVVAPDGSVYRYADIQRHNNPGVEFDDTTGEAMATPPTVGEPAPYTPPGSLGARVGNEDIAAGRALAFDPDVSLYSTLDPEGQYADTPLGYFNQAVMRVPDLALGGLLALGGGASKALGYGSDVLGLDLQPGDIPNVEEQGQLADAMFPLPTARAVGGLLATTSAPQARAAAALAVEPVLEAADVPISLLQQRRIPDYAYLTHEAQPYAAVGRDVLEGDVGVDPRPFLPDATRMTAAQRQAFFNDPRRSWVDPETGGDILSQAVGARTLPTLRGQGIYDGPDGLETNPVAVARSYATPEQLQATESLRGLLDVQGATPWVRLRQGQLPAIYFKRDGAADLDTMARMQAVGADYGLPDVIDVGEGYIVTSFDGSGSVSRAARKALEEVAGLKGIRSRAESGYPGYEKAWEKGAGRAIERYLSNIQPADPEAVAALEASPAVQKAARDRAMLAREAGQTLGGSNAVVEEMLRTVGRGEGYGDRLQHYADRLAARRIEPQLPVFSIGTKQPTPATHFSSEARAVLDPQMAFTNPSVKGAEAGLPAPYPKQTYFGLDVGQPGGYSKENFLGNVRHDADLPSGLLDISSGWSDIADEAEQIVSRIEASSGQSMTPAAKDKLMTAYQMRIAKMRGYTGLYNPQHELGPIATSFYPVSATRISGGP